MLSEIEKNFLDVCRDYPDFMEGMMVAYGVTKRKKITPENMLKAYKEGKNA